MRILKMWIAILMILGVVSACSKKATPAAPPAAPPASGDTATFTLTPSQTLSHTITSTATPTVTVTFTPSATPTVTSTPTPDSTATAMPTSCSVFGRLGMESGNVGIKDATYLLAYPVALGGPTTVHAIGVSFEYGMPAGDEIQLGIYDSSAGEPNALLASTVHFHPTYGVNYRPITPLVLPAGVYWIASMVNPSGSSALGESIPYPFTVAGSTPARTKAWVLGHLDLPTVLGTTTPANWELGHFVYSCP